MYLQNDVEMVNAELEMCLERLACLACSNFYKIKSLNDVKNINKMIVNKNILSSISRQIFNAGKEKINE